MVSDEKWNRGGVRGNYEAYMGISTGISER